MVLSQNKGMELLNSNIQLYNSAIASSKAYKEQGEELTDFDDFMAEIEKEYREKEQSWWLFFFVE